jgi:hypothetical protein
MADTKDLAALAWNGHCVYGDEKSIAAVRAAVAIDEAMPRATAAVWAAMKGVCTNEIVCKSPPCTCAEVFARAALSP